MKLKFSVFNLITGIAFLLAFVCILLSYITQAMYYPAMFLFAGAFIMLSIGMIKSYIKNNNISQEKQDAIIMELAMGEDGEKYVVQDIKKQKKLVKQQRKQSFERLLPPIISLLFAVLFCYLFISSIIALF